MKYLAEFDSEAEAQARAESAYDYLCQSSGCNVPKAQRSTKYAFGLPIKHPAREEWALPVQDAEVPLLADAKILALQTAAQMAAAGWEI